MPVGMRVPMQERDVLGGYLDIPSSGFDQPTGQQAASSKTARVVLLVTLFGLKVDIEGFALLGFEQSIGTFHGTDHRIAMEVAHRIALGMRVGKLTVKTMPVLESRKLHSLRRTDRQGRFLWKRQIHRGILAPKETCCGERFEFLLLSDPLEPLSNVDKRRDHRVVWSQYLGDPSPQMRTGYGLGWNIPSVPVVLVAGVQDTTQVRLDVGTDQGGSIHDLGHILKPLTDADVVDRRRDRGEGAHDLCDRLADLKGLVMLGVKCIGSPHPTTHPQDDDRVGLGLRMQNLRAIGKRMDKPWATESKRRGRSDGELP